MLFVYCDVWTVASISCIGAALFTLMQTLQAELGALLFLFRVSGTAVVLHTHRRLAGLESSAPHFWACLDDLTVGIDSTKIILGAEMPLQGQNCSPCDIIGLSTLTTTCSFEQAQRNVENLQALPQTLFWMNLGKPGSCLKWQSDWFHFFSLSQYLDKSCTLGTEHLNAGWEERRLLTYLLACFCSK